MTKRHPRRDVFHYSVLSRGLVVFATVASVAGVLGSLRSPDRGLPFYGLLGLSMFFACGVVGAFRERLELRDDDIRVVTLFGERTYPREQVMDARWEAGSPVSLRLRDGTWARLPAVGRSNQAVAGAVRAWLNESAGGAGR